MFTTTTTNGVPPAGEPGNPPAPAPGPGQPNPQPGPAPGGPQQQAPGGLILPPGAAPTPAQVFGQPPGTPVAQPAGGEHGYPENTPLAVMTAEQQVAYWRHYARRNEERLKEMGNYAQLKEQAEAYQKYLADSQTEQQKAVAEAEQRGRKTALAEAGSQMVEAYVRAAATGRMSQEQTDTLLQGLDRTRFVNPATGQVDAQMVAAYVGMLAPAAAPGYPPGVTYPPAVPGPAQPQQQPLTYPPAPLQAPGQAWGYPAGAVPGQPPQPQQPDMGAVRQVPSYGQAQYPIPQPRGLEAGRAIARERFGKPAAQQQ